MKSPIVFLLAITLAASFTAQAQSDMIIKQRAKNLRDANNAQQGVPPPAPTPPPAAPPPVPAPPAPPPSAADLELKRNLDKLVADLTSIKAGDPVPEDLKTNLETDLATLAKASVRPSPASLAKLAGDLSAALADKDVSLREQGQLAKAVNAIVNSSLISTLSAQSFVTVAQTSLKTSHVRDANVETVTGDLKAILEEVQKKKPKLYQ